MNQGSRSPPHIDFDIEHRHCANTNTPRATPTPTNLDLEMDGRFVKKKEERRKVRAHALPIYKYNN